MRTSGTRFGSRARGACALKYFFASPGNRKTVWISDLTTVLSIKCRFFLLNVEFQSHLGLDKIEKENMNSFLRRFSKKEDIVEVVADLAGIREILDFLKILYVFKIFRSFKITKIYISNDFFSSSLFFFELKNMNKSKKFLKKIKNFWKFVLLHDINFSNPIFSSKNIIITWLKRFSEKKSIRKFDEVIICERPETCIWGYLSSALLKSLDRFIVYSDPNWIDRWQAVSLTLSVVPLQ